MRPASGWYTLRSKVSRIFLTFYPSVQNLPGLLNHAPLHRFWHFYLCNMDYGPTLPCKSQISTSLSQRNQSLFALSSQSTTSCYCLLKYFQQIFFKCPSVRPTSPLQASSDVYKLRRFVAVLQKRFRMLRL